MVNSAEEVKTVSSISKARDIKVSTLLSEGSAVTDSEKRRTKSSLRDLGRSTTARM
jgi:hypothetical protein